MNTKAVMAGVAGAGAVGAVAVKVLRGGKQDAGRESELRRHVSDMLALDNHLLQAVARQLNDEMLTSNETQGLLDDLRSMLDRHIAQLDDHLEELGGHPTAPLKQAATTVGGTAASLVDRFRTEPMSRALRDDYVALSMISVSYAMLNTTARFCGDDELAALTADAMVDVAAMVMRLGEAIPYAVQSELEAHGVDGSAAGDPAGDAVDDLGNAFAQGENGTSSH